MEKRRQNKHVLSIYLSVLVDLKLCIAVLTIEYDKHIILLPDNTFEVELSICLCVSKYNYW